MILIKPHTQTTIIRELARVLSTDLCIETLIIDTSNEIAGDGMTAHDCVGNARRMMVRICIGSNGLHRVPCHSTNGPIHTLNCARQVRSRDHQADVMIEGVQVRSDSIRHAPRTILSLTCPSHHRTTRPSS